MGGKGGAPDTPDYGPIAASSEEAARIQQEVAMEQLDWAREQFYENQDLLDIVLQQQLPAMEEQIANARQDRDYYQSVFRPLEVSLAQEAEDYASPEKIELDAARASADVAQAYDQQREQALRQLEGYGIDPGQTRFNALDRNLRGQQAAMQAAASNKQREATENIGRALRGEAINMGRGLPTDIARAYGQGVAAGNTGLQGALNTTATGAQSMGTGVDWAGMSNASNNTAISALNTGFQNRMSGYNAEGASAAGYGNLLGTIGGAYLGGAPAGSAASRFLYGGEEGMYVEPTGDPPLDPSVSGDNQIAAVKDGEYVIPAPVVKAKGTEFFDRMVEKYTGKNPSEEPKKELALEDGGVVPPATGLPLYEYGGSVVPRAPSGAGVGPGIPMFEEGGAQERYAAHQARFATPSQPQSSSLDQYRALMDARSGRRADWQASRAAKPQQERQVLENRAATGPVLLDGRTVAADVLPSGYETVDITNPNATGQPRRMAIPEWSYTYDQFDEELGRNRAMPYTREQQYQNLVARQQAIHRNLQPGEYYYDDVAGTKIHGGPSYYYGLPADPSRPSAGRYGGA